MRVAIIGAGLSGLSCAHQLETKGFNGQVDIFEERSSLGTVRLSLNTFPSCSTGPFLTFSAIFKRCSTLVSTH